MSEVLFFAVTGQGSRIEFSLSLQILQLHIAITGAKSL
jgi:hypothetical protein